MNKGIDYSIAVLLRLEINVEQMELKISDHLNII